MLAGRAIEASRGTNPDIWIGTRGRDGGVDIQNELAGAAGLAARLGRFVLVPARAANQARQKQARPVGKFASRTRRAGGHAAAVLGSVGVRGRGKLAGRAHRTNVGGRRGVAVHASTAAVGAHLVAIGLASKCAGRLAGRTRIAKSCAASWASRIRELIDRAFGAAGGSGHGELPEWATRAQTVACHEHGRLAIFAGHRFCHRTLARRTVRAGGPRFVVLILAGRAASAAEFACHALELASWAR